MPIAPGQRDAKVREALAVLALQTQPGLRLLLIKTTQSI
jgi:hypothetical protein